MITVIEMSLLKCRVSVSLISAYSAVMTHDVPNVSE